MASTPVVYPQLTTEFKTRRTFNWLSVGLLYAFFYATRYNWAVVSPRIANVLGWQNTQLGVFETVMPIVYGLSVILNGPIADRIGGKKAFLIGAVGVVIMNVLVGLASFAVVTPAVWEGVKTSRHLVTPATLRAGVTPGGLLTIMAVTWGLNGYFQAFGALSIVKVNASWFHVRERGTFSGVFGVLIRLGLLLAFQGVPLLLLAFHDQWQYAFWIPAGCVAVFIAINAAIVKNTPREAGFGEFETGDAAEGDPGPASVGFVLRKIFASRAAWTIALGSMMIGFVRRSHLDAWWPRYLEQYQGADPAHFATYAPYVVATWGIALAGIAGGFAFGIASDRRFGSRRAPVIVAGFLGMAVALAASGVADHLHLGAMSAMVWLVVLSFCVNGAHGMIGGAASMDFGGRKATATAAGLFDGMQYLTGFIVGPGVPLVLKRWGWEAWHWAPVPFALAGAALTATLWNVVPSRKAGH
jgi:OPA family glycerol-3-phosphate transporter-like MFS transporter